MFFLFKQKTAYESRISDWSSDVCSSDLDVVSMARPLLADPDFVKKAAQGRADEINTCIACNQACLDHAFQLKMASCLVNPRACHETELNYTPAANRKRIAVVGAGPAGLATATDRKSVVEGKSVSVRVDIGGGRIIKKKKTKEQKTRKIRTKKKK